MSMALSPCRNPFGFGTDGLIYICFGIHFFYCSMSNTFSVNTVKQWVCSGTLYLENLVCARIIYFTEPKQNPLLAPW